MAFQEEIDLIVAADDISQPRHADRLEAALGGRHALDRPRSDRLGNTLDLVLAEVAQTEEIAEQPARGGRDDDRLWLGQGQKAGCNVRRVPDHGVLPQRTLATEVADYHQARRDANADREWFRGACLERGNSGNDIEPRPYGSLSVVFVRARIAEIGQYPVAPELGEKTVIG